MAYSIRGRTAVTGKICLKDLRPAHPHTAAHVQWKAADMFEELRQVLHGQAAQAGKKPKPISSGNML